MQAASRHLSPVSEARSPFCCVIEDTRAVAGGAAAWHILGGSVEAVGDCAVLIALFLDPEAHARRQLQRYVPTHGRGAVVVQIVLYQKLCGGGLAQHLAREASSFGGSAAPFLLIDSLDAAVIRCGAGEVAAALSTVTAQKLVRGVVAHTHGPAQSPQTLAALRGLATCTVVLKRAKALQCEVIQKATGHRVHLEAIASTLRNSGRVKIESELLEVRPEGQLVQRRDPCNSPITAQQLAAQQVADLKEEQAGKEAAEHAKLQSKYESDMSGFMKLSLSEKEKEAREGVVLPWQHGEEQMAAKGEDFKSYLPPAAGGHAKGAGSDGLGHILYVRDSDNDYDSDEDPDDDLDI